jgi:hypothetical protein
MGEPQWLVQYRGIVDSINSGTFNWSAQQSASQAGPTGSNDTSLSSTLKT